MSWEREVEEIRRRERLAHEMGGEESVARPRAAGKLDVRARIATLLDAGSFHETGALAGRAVSGADGRMESFRPSNFVFGTGSVGGRKIVVGGDFRALAGQSRTNLGRLYPNGTLDTDSNASAGGIEYSLALQPDGRILAGGEFTKLCRQTIQRIGRLNPDGTLDTNFVSSACDRRYQIFHQLDEAGRPRVSLARLKEPGTFDPDQMPGMQFRGVALFTVILGPLPALRAFDELVVTARALATTLGGHLQDERGGPLTVQRLTRLREEVTEFERSGGTAPGT